MRSRPLALHRDILGEEARERDARGRFRAIAAKPHRRERLLGEHARRRPRARTAADRASRRRAPLSRSLCWLPSSQCVARSRLSTASRSRTPVQPKAGSLAALTASTVRRDLADIGLDRRAARERQLARDEIDRLDAVGAFVDRRDARVAIMLRRAGLLDVAHAAVHLHAERGDLAADVGRERLGDRREQRGALVRGLARALRRSPRCGAVDRDRGGVADRARRARERAHGQQHALDVGMRDDRARAGRRAGGAALPALARIGERLLRRALGDGDALQRRRRAAPGSSS